MTRTKSKAVIMGADGAGGMAQIHDRRFERGEWPIHIEITEPDQRDSWFKYLSSECAARGWSSGGLAQLDAKENSGSHTVTPTDGSVGSQIVIVWERKRDGPLSLRARTTGELSVELAGEFLERVTEKCRSRVKESFYMRGQLQYDGLPWRGELWLSDALRLGPPSKQDETALFGPRVVLIDAVVEAVERTDAAGVFALLRREITIFLGVVLRIRTKLPPSGRAWTYEGVDKTPQSQVRWLGYIETETATEMPPRGMVSSLSLAQVRRPDFSITGVRAEDREQDAPDDIVELWEAFSALDAQRRQQFLQVASMWHLALSLGHEYQTTAFAWKVVATEALKPAGPQFRDHNIYEVVEELLGKSIANVLRKDGIRPQEIRNAHLHRGEYRGSEFVFDFMMSSFHDPTFDTAHRVLTGITHATIIEWLRRRGEFTMPALIRRKSWRRWAKRHTITAAAIAVALVLGWLGHGMWQR